jgi:predicted ATPase
VRSVRLLRDEVPSFDEYPFTIPAVRSLDELELDPKVTCFVGENGSGKSTLLEAIAVAAGFNPEGGTKNFRFSTRSSESPLHRYLRLVRGVRRFRDGFFLRAESYFNLGSEIEALDREPANAPPIINSYGGRSLHEMSHGESFLTLAEKRFGGDGFYVLDEPEAALSPSRQLTLLKIMHELVEQKNSQFVISSHSPILLAYPGARLYHLTMAGLEPIAYEDTEHYQITRSFLTGRERYFKHLFGGED